MEVTAATFTDTMAALPALLVARKAVHMADLAHMLREAPDTRERYLPTGDADVLALTTSVFVCPKPDTS